MTNHSVFRIAAFFAAGGFVAALFLAGMAQAVTDTVFKYSTTRTGWLAIPPASFSPTDTTNTSYFAFNNGSILQIKNAQSCVMAPVNLPQAATMTDLAIWYGKNGGDVFILLVRMLNTTGAQDLVVNRELADSSGGRRGATFSIAEAQAKIDNAHYSYWLFFCAINALDAFFTNARITYTYNNAGD